mgnify:CR=1 FL=1
MKKKDESLTWIERQFMNLFLNRLIKKANLMKGSFKTSIGGVGTLLCAIGGALVAFSDGTLDINDFQTIVSALTGMGLFTGFGLVKARDNGVTSKQAGAE